MRFVHAALPLLLAACLQAPPAAPPASSGYSGPPGAYGDGAYDESAPPGDEEPGYEPGPEDGQPGMEPDSPGPPGFDGPDSPGPPDGPDSPDAPDAPGPDGALGPAPLRSAAPKDATPREFEAGVIAAINHLRRDPAWLVSALQRHRRHYRDRHLVLPGVDAPVLTMEGVAAVDEAIAAARRARRVPELRLSPGLSRAARAHAAEIGRAGTVEHDGRDGSEPLQRMERHGRVLGLSGENIGTGWGGPEVMVLSLFIDDGVGGRGHRVNLLEPDYRAIGVGCAPHRRYGTVCVLDMAAGFRE
jgi:hypothetical protein